MENQLTLDVREQFIISQALCVAIKTMAKEKYPEESNIEDMKILIEDKFPLWKAIDDASDMINALNTGCGTTES